MAEQLDQLLDRLGKGDDPLGNFARSIITHRIPSQSAEEEVTETEGSTDPFAYDKNVKLLSDMGLITDEERNDPVALAATLAELFVNLRNKFSEMSSVPASNLNQELVSHYSSLYQESLVKVPYLEVVYNDPLMFYKLAPEEAAGLAQALIKVTKQSNQLWDTVSTTGRGM